MSLINFDSKMLKAGVARPNSIIKTDCLNQMSIYDRPVNTHECKDYGEAIMFFSNVIDKDMCQHIIDTTYKSSYWEKAITTGESDGSVKAEDSPRQNDICFISSNPNLKDMDEYIHRVLSSTLSTYLNKLGFDNIDNAGITADEGYSMLRYGSGGYYKQHIDYSSQVTNGNSLIRVATALIYLNDDYGDGEVLFNRHKVSFKPSQGGILFFPSIFTHPHTAQNISSGTKYCIVTWWK